MMTKIFYVDRPCSCITGNHVLKCSLKIPQAFTAAFYAHGIVYEKSEVWIESEKMYEVLFRTAVLASDEAIPDDGD